MSETRKTSYLIIQINKEMENAIKQITPSSDNSVDICINAKSFEDAIELITEAESIAAEKMKSYCEEQEEEQELKEKEHYNIAPITREKAAREIEKYKLTSSGNRFYAEIENSHLFMRKIDRGLGAVSAVYLALEGYAESPYTSIMHSYDLGYRRGYNAGKREEKAKYNKAT